MKSADRLKTDRAGGGGAEGGEGLRLGEVVRTDGLAGLLSPDGATPGF